MAYQEMPIEHARVDELRLDLTNYRFASDQPDEASAMNYLFADHDAMDLATLILRDTYVDNEIPFVVREDGHYVLLEGNRRLAALRALRNPALVPARQAELAHLLRKFSIEAANLPESIRVMVIPDREAARTILARLHIGESKRSWSLDEQAKFVLAQLTGGVSVEGLRNLLPAINDVPRLVRMGRIRQMLRSCAFTDPVIADYATGPRLPMSAFEYAYRNPEIQKLVGVRFETDGNLAARTSTKEQIHALEVLLAGFMGRRLSSRKVLNRKDSDEYRELIAAMEGVAPPPAASDATTSSPAPSPDDVPNTGPRDTSGLDGPSASREDGSARDGTQAGSRRGPNSPETRTTLDMTGIDEQLLAVTLKYRVRELRRINVIDLSAAAALLLRTVIEAAIKEHYAVPVGVAMRRQLSDVMADVTRDYGSTGSLSHAISTINRTGRGAEQVPGSGEWFNRIAHTVDMPVDGPAVHKAWRAVYPLVRYLLERPGGGAQPSAS